MGVKRSGVLSPLLFIILIVEIDNNTCQHKVRETRVDVHKMERAEPV